MQPLKLTIKGINSYVSAQTVDFKKLSQSKLFGIFGDTGSGKTTILDAITLSLYGTTDRDCLQNIINVNCKDAYIEFEFEMSDSKSTIFYYVKREYKIRASGLKTDAILLDENKKVLAQGSDDVNDAILKIIGIAKKEFLKCIALPQGEFDKFLLDTPINRKKTIAKLFDLEGYGIALNDKIKARKDSATLKRMLFEDKLSVYDGLNESFVESTVKKLEEYRSKKEITLQNIFSLESNLIDLKEKLKNKQRLFELDVNYTILKNEKTEIDKLKEDVDFTLKFGEISTTINKYKTCQNNIEDLSSTLIINRYSLQKAEETLKIKLQELNELKSKQEYSSKVLEIINLQKEKKLFFETRINELNFTISNLQNYLYKNTLDIKNSAEKLTEVKSNIQQLELNKNKLNRTIKKNSEAIERLISTGDLTCRQDFVDFLTTLKNEISPENLSQISNYPVFEEINFILRKMETYEVEIRKEVNSIKNNIGELTSLNKNTSSLVEQLKQKNAEYTLALEIIDKSLSDANILFSKTNEHLLSLNENENEKKSSLSNTFAELNDLSEKINSLDKVTDFDGQNTQNIILTEQINDINKLINLLNNEREQSIINLEVNTNKLKNDKLMILELKSKLHILNIKNIDDVNILNKPILNTESLNIAKNKIENFDKNINTVCNEIESLKEKTKSYNVTPSDIAKLEFEIKNEKSTLNEIEVFISINQYTIEVQKKNLIIVKDLQCQLDEINKTLTTLNKLQSMVQNGALLEFVSEEYMHLITNFANKYVYSISKGKYLLKYDGEFNVLDNFNGGIKRSVKTLSGGERFIISLSLSLGISQSIAVNNNKNFSFFFIDEGFGSLSETYLEKVLQAFNELIALNFTIGFISHVEKMQLYINNKIFVTKENNEAGSQITMYNEDNY